MNQTIEQQRAKHAWEAVCRMKANPDKNNREKYGGQAKELPMRIMTSGLGQALVFIHSKKYAPQLLKDLGEWVLSSISHSKQGIGEDDLIREIIKGNSDFLRRTTSEALAYLQWLNRFAEAEGLKE